MHTHPASDLIILLSQSPSYSRLLHFHGPSCTDPDTLLLILRYVPTPSTSARVPQCTQSIHHMLPSVSLVHYQSLYPKFIRICQQHGCMPQRSRGFGHAIIQHWRYVYALGADGTDFSPPRDIPPRGGAAVEVVPPLKPVDAPSEDGVMESAGMEAAGTPLSKPIEEEEVPRVVVDKPFPAEEQAVDEEAGYRDGEEEDR